MKTITITTNGTEIIGANVVNLTNGMTSPITETDWQIIRTLSGAKESDELATAKATAAELQGKLTAALADLATEKATRETEIESRRVALNAAHRAAIEQLRAEMQPIPPPSDSLTQLNELFSASIPAELQPAFAVPYAIVRVLVQAGQLSLAAAVIRDIEAPESLQPAKQAMIDLLTA